MTKASKHLDPPVPKTNAWEIDSGLEPGAHALAAPGSATRSRNTPGRLCQGEPTAVLGIVRRFSLADEEADLGFWLDESWLAILRQTGAQLDVNVYDYTTAD
jgi:hypothetical protein